MQIIDFTPQNKTLIKKFYEFPLHLYSQTPQYIPPFKIQLLGNPLLLIPGLLSHKHPFHLQADIHYFIIQNHHSILGRIACFVDHQFNSSQKSSPQKSYPQKSNTGTFGFLEVVHDYSVFKTLLDASFQWFKKRNISKIIGPLNFSQEQTLGLLIHGFQKSNSFNTTYNFPYYQQFLENYGFKKEKDLFAYSLPIHHLYQNPRFNKISSFVQKIKKYYSISTRPIQFKNSQNFKRDIQLLVQVYNQSWIDNWGFIPISFDDAFAQSRFLKIFSDPHLINFFYVKKQIAAVSICLPDVNQMISQKSSSNPSFSPSFLFTFLSILLKKHRSQIHTLRFWAMGILKPFRKIGIEAVIYHTIYEYTIQKNPQYQSVEISWVLEDNQPIIRASKSLGAHHIKTWRIFDLTCH